VGDKQSRIQAFCETGRVGDGRVGDVQCGIQRQERRQAVWKTGRTGDRQSERQA
jgi:hypothetical protein